MSDAETNRLSTEIDTASWDEPKPDRQDEDDFETIWSKYAPGSQERADFIASISGVLSPDEIARLIEEIDRQIKLDKMYDED